MTLTFFQWQRDVLAKWCKDVFLDAQHTVSKSSGSKGVANTDALTRRDSFHIFEHV